MRKVVMLKPNAGPYANAPDGKIHRTAFLGYRLQAFVPRKHPIRGIIIHTTGSGPYEQWRDHAGVRTPWEAARRIYESISKHAPHFLVCGETGLIVQGVPSRFAAWHTGKAGAWRYRLPGWDKEVTWWRKRWPELDSPRSLLEGALWAQGTANDLTLGIDVSPSLDGPRAPWSQRCWTSLGWLVRLLAKEHQVPLTDTCVLSHSDCHPRARSSGNRPWDPGPMQWPGRTALSLLNPMGIS